MYVKYRIAIELVNCMDFIFEIKSEKNKWWKTLIVTEFLGQQLRNR